jgi:hypothetical protein
VANPLKHIVVSSSLNWLEAKREENYNMSYHIFINYYYWFICSVLAFETIDVEDLNLVFLIEVYFYLWSYVCCDFRTSMMWNGTC